jgi:hypothetical protein
MQRAGAKGYFSKGISKNNLFPYISIHYMDDEVEQGVGG